MNIIEADSLTRMFDSHVALDGVSFSVQQGSVFGFLGRNGARKTTALKIITGTVPPASVVLKALGFLRRVVQACEGKPVVGVNEAP